MPPQQHDPSPPSLSTASPVPRDPPTSDAPPDPEGSGRHRPTRITVAIVGDIMLGRGVAAIHPDPTTTLSGLRPVLRRADITVGNLESTLSTRGTATQGSDSFAADPSVLDGLRRTGFDVLSLANNHTGDYGERALIDTVAAFEGSGISSVGAGHDLAQASAPAIETRDGVTVGFLAFNAIGETPRAGRNRSGALSVRMPPRTGPLDRGDLRHVLTSVRRLDERVDAVVVLPHWGTQYTHTPEPAQRAVGRALVEAGADLVVGGHPHWVQSVERYRDVVIAHSLGNAVFDMDFMEQTMEGMVLTATVGPDGVDHVGLRPYRMDADFVPRLVRGATARSILADARSGR